MATMSSGNDIVAYLKAQHQQIKMLFGEVTAAHGEQRARAFFALRRLLAVHETAEEEIVHPAARRALPDGKGIIEARLREEHAAKKVLAELEKLDVDSSEFETRLLALQASILTHAEAEEKEEFERLPDHLDAARLARMRRAAELAEAIAPTRPHPGVESAFANMIAGPFVSVVDRMRDAMSGKA
jgi:hemerythrin superfamily protein